MKTGRLFAASLTALCIAACATGARADFKVTVGVGHMCCGSCKKDATAALTNVASDVNIDGKTITMTVKQNDVAPALAALRTAGFPPLHVDAGSAPVTIAVGHMCCAHCISDLRAALANAKIDALNTDAITAEMGKLVVKAKDGMKLDLITVINAMEAGGFSATKISMGNAVAVQGHSTTPRLAKNNTAHR